MKELTSIRSRFEAYGLLGLVSRPVKALLVVMAFFAVMSLIDLGFPVPEIQERLNRSHPNNVPLLIAFSYEYDSTSGSAYSRTYVLVPDSIVSGSLYVGYGSDGPSGHSAGLATIPVVFWLGVVLLLFLDFRWYIWAGDRSAKQPPSPDLWDERMVK